MKNKFIVILALAFFTLSFANEKLVKLSNQANDLQVIGKSSVSMNFSVSVGEIKHFDVETKNGIYSQIIIPTFQRSHNVGEPSLPNMNKIIEIPFGAEIETEIVSFKEEIFSLTELGINNKLMPTQASLSKSEKPENVPFLMNNQIYDENRFYSLSEVNVKNLGIMRYRNLALVEISPIQYNPVTNQIKVYTEMEIKISFRNSDLISTMQTKNNYFSPFFETAFGNIEKLDAKDDPQSLLRFPQKYVVVVPTEFLGTMQSFIDWKTQQGFEVIVYEFSSPANRTTVQTYLHGLYENATEENPAPTYILMVGDDDKLPAFDGTTGGHITDLPFADVTGDKLPDMYIARFSARTVDELIPYVEKTLYYEKYEIEDPTYLNNITLIAGWDSGFTPTHGLPTVRYGGEYYYTSANGFNTTVYETTGSGQFENDIVDDVNVGVALVNYTAHGSQTSWADPGMGISDVEGFTNLNKYTLAIGNACLTASFEVGECFGEAWLRQPNKGGIGYIGGTNSTYWDEDVFWSTGFFDHIGDGVTPTPDETTLGAYETGFVTDDLTTQSAMIYVGNFAVATSGSNLTNYYWEIYQLFGDPSLMVYWGEPSEMEVQHLPILLIGSSSFDVNVTGVSKALIGLTKSGVLVGSAMTDENGNATIQFANPLTETGEYKLTITAQNKIPYVLDIQAIVPANVELNPTEMTILTQGTLNVTVTDTSNAAMQNVNIWISSPGYSVDTVQTNENGVAQLSVNSPVGSILEIFGKRSEDSYLLFTDTLQIIGGQEFTSVDLTVVTDFGLVDTFSVNQAGNVYGGEIDGEYTVYVGGNGEYYTENAEFLTYTPVAKNDVRAYIVKSGFNTYTEKFPVVNAIANFGGTVTSNGDVIEGATVILYRNGEEEFRTTTNYQGTFESPDQVEVGNVTLEVKAFGYETLTQDYFVVYPENDIDFQLNRATSSYISGFVKNEEGENLSAIVKIYRFDTGELYKTLYTDNANVGFFADTLVNFDFNVRVKSTGYKQLDTLISVTTETIWNFELKLPDGILVLSADSKGYFADKECTIQILDTEKIAKSSSEICDSLSAWGIDNTLEDVSATDLETWSNYSAIFYVQGSASGLISDEIQTKMIEFVGNEGILLIEGGELGYSNRSEPIASAVLHFSSWNHDQSGSINVNQQRHPIWNLPNTLPSTFSISYSGYGDHDALTALTESERISKWSTYPTDASLIAYNNQVVYFAFNFAKISTSGVKHDLLENAIKYLQLLPEVGIEDQIINQTPTDFSLSQNYPNPFNPSTKINFALPSNSFVTLKVYDILGSEVTTLVNGEINAGRHEITFDATKLASGIYFYRIQAGNSDNSGQPFVQTRKMILIK